jgi:hypothetical protein
MVAINRLSDNVGGVKHWLPRGLAFVPSSSSIAGQLGFTNLPVLLDPKG